MGARELRRPLCRDLWPPKEIKNDCRILPLRVAHSSLNMPDDMLPPFFPFKEQRLTRLVAAGECLSRRNFDFAHVSMFARSATVLVSSMMLLKALGCVEELTAIIFRTQPGPFPGFVILVHVLSQIRHLSKSHYFVLLKNAEIGFSLVAPAVGSFVG